MTPKALKKWMDDRGLTPVDVAAALKIDPSTVKRFLAGGAAHRSTIAAYERFVIEERQVPKNMNSKKAS